MKGLIFMRPAAVLLLSALILLATPGRSCRGDLVLFHYAPNAATISGENSSVSYDAGSHVFNASVDDPNALNYNSAATSGNEFVPVDPQLDGTANLSFNLLVDNDGHFLANGSGVNFSGGLDFDGDGTDDASGTLLTGTITAFGSGTTMGPPTTTFDGLFQVTGGLLTQEIQLSYGGTLPAEISVGTIAGFSLFTEQFTSGILGDFAASFSGTNLKSDASPIVPEPGSLVLALSGMAALGGFGLTRRRRRAGAQRR